MAMQMPFKRLRLCVKTPPVVTQTPVMSNSNEDAAVQVLPPRLSDGDEYAAMLTQIPVVSGDEYAAMLTQMPVVNNASEDAADEVPPPLFSDDDDYAADEVPTVRTPLKRLRLRAKTTPVVTQTSVVSHANQYAADEVANSRKSVYLLTFPHPRQDRSKDGVRFVAPGTLTRKALLGKVRDCFAHPDYADLKNKEARTSIDLYDVVVFLEYHQEDEQGIAHAHFHVAVRAYQFRFLPVKRALLARHGLACHFGCKHEGYWSVLRYCAVPSPKKPKSALDPKPLLWSCYGKHLPLMESVHEPLTASATRNRRLAMDMSAAESGKAAPKITDLDVYPVVVRQDICNSADYPFAHLELIAYAKKHCSVPMQAYVWKHRARLPGLIDDVWQWENVEDVLKTVKESRYNAVQRAACSPCVCNGDWLTAVVSSFLLNHVDVQALSADVLHAIVHGRSETTPVVVLAGSSGGEGKSLFLKGLFALFGEEMVFQMPEKSNFPLLNLDKGPKVAFLDEWRFVNNSVSFGTQCLWFDGSAVPVARPQNVPGCGGNFLYRGTAPVFVTGKLEDIVSLTKQAALDPLTQLPKNADASMLLRRLKVHEYRVRIPKPPRTRSCARCFAQLLLGQAGGCQV